MPLTSAFPLLQPSGTIALAERGLMLHAVEFMLIVAIPVYILLFFFAWKYRAGNTKAKYMPDWEHSKMDELVWWAIPFEIILILGALTWSSTHALAPNKPLDSARGEPPLVVQVVALNWKWLFIYPEEGIATINYLRIPVGRPVQFEVTADAPMNSFWVPQLGGQIYAMTGMSNVLNLEASETGTFAGGSANYSGAGFAGMKFVVEAVPEDEFDAWAQTTKLSANVLSDDSYTFLARPSTGDPVAYYGEVEDGLYTTIMEKYMDLLSPGAHHH
ncbi:MAG TPA: ubiquinol oxidase subunit II [Candidatus Paceibacterota bacterium]|nr:ubiquinol oxidase subunit II [Candidatus Paceibacterota bacterium]